MRRIVSRLTLLGLAVALLLLAQPVSSQGDVSILDLGPSTGTGYPKDLNERGDVVGWHGVPGSKAQRFLWTLEAGWIELPGDGQPYACINNLKQVAFNKLVDGVEFKAILYDGGEETTLGTLGGTYAMPTDINEAGHVAGQGITSGGQIHCFLWTSTGGLRDLGTLGGNKCSTTAMNETPWSVGYSDLANGEYRAFLWTETDGMTDLGTLGGDYSAANDVNDAGQVVGISNTAAGVDRAFLWTKAEGMTDLGTLGGDSSSALAISESGHVVGWSYTSGNAQHAFIWTPEGGMQDLGALGGGRSRATGISGSGQAVIGISWLATGQSRAFFWTASSGMIELGTLPGGQVSDAVDVNEHGQVVGWSSTEVGDRHVVLWTVVLDSPEDQMIAIMAEIEQLVDDGILKAGQANALIQKLENAIRLLEAEKSGATCNQLEAFINQVETYTKTGQLTEEAGLGLIDAAQGIVGLVCE